MEDELVKQFINNDNYFFCECQQQINLVKVIWYISHGKHSLKMDLNTHVNRIICKRFLTVKSRLKSR